MRSGDPDPIDDLKLLLDTKRHAPTRTVDVVSSAARWLKAALKGADIAFNYSSCAEGDHFGFAAFTLIRTYRDQPVSLDLKIAEVRETPYFFAEVRVLGKIEGTLFPFFGDLRSDDSRELLLHYIADFVISTQA